MAANEETKAQVKKSNSKSERSSTADAMVKAVESLAGKQEATPQEVELEAYAPVDGAFGHVEKGDTFTCSAQDAKFLQKTGAAGPVGAYAQDVLAEVAAEEFQDRRNAGSLLAEARSTHRNLSPASGERGNSPVAEGVGPVIGAQ